MPRRPCCHSPGGRRQTGCTDVPISAPLESDRVAKQVAICLARISARIKRDRPQKTFAHLLREWRGVVSTHQPRGCTGIKRVSFFHHKRSILLVEKSLDGYLFRSCVEARRAKFWSALGIRYFYEHEGFNLGHGMKYLVDFYLPDLRLHVEVKGDRSQYTAEVREKASRLAELSGIPTAVLVGDVWLPGSNSDSHYCHRPDGTFSDRMQWAECPQCGTVGFTMFGWASLLPCGCTGDRDTGPPLAAAATPRLMKAYRAARSERFGVYE
jgi:hypothetical protein